jgi:hypothetical protein
VSLVDPAQNTALPTSSSRSTTIPSTVMLVALANIRNSASHVPLSPVIVSQSTCSTATGRHPLESTSQPMFRVAYWVPASMWKTAPGLVIGVSRSLNWTVP